MFGLKALRCRGVNRAGWRYLDDTLSANRRARIEKHLNICLNCRTEYARRMAVLEALKQGLPIDTALVKKTKSIRKYRLPRFAVIGLTALLAVGAGWYLFKLSPTLGDWTTDWKLRVSGPFSRSTGVDVKERTVGRSSANTDVSSVGEPSSIVLGDAELFVAPKATVRVIKPEAHVVISPVNSEPKERGSGLGVTGSEETTRRLQEKNRGKKAQSVRSQIGNPHKLDLENRVQSGAKIEIYDESGQLIKSERVKAEGRR